MKTYPTKVKRGDRIVFVSEPNAGWAHHWRAKHDRGLTGIMATVTDNGTVHSGDSYVFIRVDGMTTSHETIGRRIMLADDDDNVIVDL